MAAVEVLETTNIMATMTFQKEKRPTNIERVQNVGLFGRGCGNFDAFGNAP